MARSLLLLVMSLAVTAAAQNQPSKATGAQSQPEKTKSADITIRGCITGGQRYTLAQLSTGAMFALRGDRSQLAPLQGKVAEVHATELPPDQHSASGELPQLEVKDIKQVSDTCPTQPKAKADTTTTGPAYGGAQAPQPAPSVATPQYGSSSGNTVPPNGGQNPNISGAHGAPSPGTGNVPPPQQPPPQR